MSEPRLGCVVVAEPRDGSPAVPFIAPTGAAMRAAAKAESQPEKYRVVTLASVFRRVELEKPE